jgi:hypothetical protein
MFERIAKRVREMIGVTRHVMRVVSSRLRRSSFSPTKDVGRTDYAFWDKARRGKAAGLEISGLFIKPLASKIAAWTLGRKPNWKTEDEPSQQALNKWWGGHHADILRAWREALALGDHFIVINADMSVTVLDPDIVDPIVSEDDYSQIVGWRITQVYEHPDRLADRMVIVDEYTADERTRTVTRNGAEQTIERFPNLIGLVPVIHVPNLGGSDEVFGRPEGEALIPALQKYGDVLNAGVDGVIRQGHSTPAINFNDPASLDKFWASFGKQSTQTLEDGTTETTNYVEFDADQLVTISNGTFDWKSPASFSIDTQNILALLFWLILQHTEVPEFIWGNAIASSQASAEAQLPPFVTYIETRQGEIAKWLIPIGEVILGILSLTEPGVRAQKPTPQFKSLIGDDKRLTLDTLQWAFSERLLDRRTALMLAPVEIEDIDSVLAEADKEAEERTPEQLRQFNPLADTSAMEAEIARLEAGGSSDDGDGDASNV